MSPRGRVDRRSGGFRRVGQPITHVLNFEKRFVRILLASLGPFEPRIDDHGQLGPRPLRSAPPGCGSCAGRWRAGTATRWGRPGVQTAAGAVAVAADETVNEAEM